MMHTNSKEKRPRNPRINANIFEILTFSWTINLFKIGRSRDLEEKDLYATLDEHSSSKLVNELEKKWTMELKNARKSNNKPSFLRALINLFGADYMFYGILLCFDELFLKIFQPIFIVGVLNYYNPDASKKSDIKHAYVCASGLLIDILISIFLLHFTYNGIAHWAMKVRVACSSILFKKALRLSHSALGETTVGQVLNLLTNDMNRFNRPLLSPQYIWIGPLQTTLVTYFLWQEIGVSSLFGIVILLFVVPLQGWLGKKIFGIRLKTAKLTDERGRLINEVIASIQVIKMYAWEKPFSKLVEYARKKEIGQIKRITFIHAVSFIYRGILIKFQLFACIMSYVLFGNYISIQKVFVIMTFYSLLQNTMTVFFCTGLSQIGDLLATVKRFQNFLILEEKDITYQSKSPNAIHSVNINETKNSNENLEKIGIDISNATAAWEKNKKNNTLNDINLKIGPSQLTAIIGPVGAGKSSILNLILREILLSEGSVSVRGVVSYASQEPWLFSGSVQQNILFDSPMNEERYKQVIISCGLDHDFKQFPYGDRTIVGEKGVTLSGGQKSRINLARAIYKEADIYLLDDPLSAVDSRVCKDLFEKCIKGYLKDKTCVLTTHQLQILGKAERIVLIKEGERLMIRKNITARRMFEECMLSIDGRIVSQGSYQEIVSSGTDFEYILEFSDATKVVSDIIGEMNVFDNVSKECITSTVDDDNCHEDKIKPNEDFETRLTGHISKNVYGSFISAFGSSFIILFLLIMYIITQVLVTTGDLWIIFWANQEDYVFRNINNSSNAINTSMNYHSLNLSSSNFRQINIIVFIILNILMIIAISIRCVIFVKVCTKASLNLHRLMFNAILKAKMSFFHLNSSGRILNRFSNDMGTIDEQLPFILLEVFQMVSRILGIIFIVVLTKFELIIPTIIMGIMVYYMRSLYISTSQNIKRLEGVARSPVLGHMNTSIQGLTTIRAYKAEQAVYKEFYKHQDFHSSVWYIFICLQEAFAFWVDVFCLAYISIIVFSILYFSDSTFGGYVGLVITQIIGMIGVLQYLLIQSSELENQMVSVERVLEYTRCPQELDNHCHLAPDGWPYSGRIVFKNLSLRYSQNSPYILKNLNFQILSSEKVGIVGRTGAGKSSIIQALFRLAFDEGEIIIDDVEIHELGLNDLRSKISVIPQDPILYSGTMRYNLDPFDEFPDHVLWNALEEVQLKTTIENLPGSLNSKISENGSNFSVGQKQLICLARALLRKNKILILDEATANIDTETDVLIQNTIRKNFKTSTVLTVAHRLNTIIDSDRVLVIDNGSMIEFDHPHVLLEKKDGLFYSMVEQTGRASVDLLHRVAAQNFKVMPEEK